jgi:hypothetical protein
MTFKVYFIRIQLNFPYKIAIKISEILIYFQTKSKFDEISTWSLFKYPHKQIWVKKLRKVPDMHRRGLELIFVATKSKI